MHTCCIGPVYLENPELLLQQQTIIKCFYLIKRKSQVCTKVQRKTKGNYLLKEICINQMIEKNRKERDLPDKY